MEYTLTFRRVAAIAAVAATDAKAGRIRAESSVLLTITDVANEAQS